MPRPRRGKGAEAAGSSGETPHKKDATASSGGLPMEHPGKGAAGSGSVSTRRMMQKKAAAAAVLMGEATTVDPRKVTPISDSSGGMLQKKAAAAASSGEATTVDPRKVTAISDSSGGMLQIKAAAAASSGELPTMDPWMGPAASDSSEGMLAVSASRGASAASGALHGHTTAQDCEESAAKHRTKKARTVSSANIPHEHCTEDEGDMGLSPKVEPDTALTTLDMLPQHAAEEADTAKDIQESDSNEIVVHAKEEDTEVQEAESLIQMMNDCGIGESISTEDFHGFFHRLPSLPPWIDLEDTLKDEEVDQQKVRHALYRFRYLKHKFSEQGSNEELQDDDLKSLLSKSEQDCTQDFIQEEGFFRRFEDNYTLDWVFHRDYLKCSSLSDYQRLVLQNYGGTEYSRWREYHRFLHSHKIEKEYVQYCEELSNKLKWMESYLGDNYQSTVMWEYISSRGALQAIKIAATGFHEVTPELAYLGFHECQDSMLYDLTWFKELDGVYFEIWRRVTQPMSFKDALEEVYKLDKFPVRQRLMKGALEHDYTMKSMEKDFKTCISAITLEEKKNDAKVAEDKAKELIAEAVNKLVVKPKSYDQYIRKKIDIAKFLGILPPED